MALHHNKKDEEYELEETLMDEDDLSQDDVLLEDDDTFADWENEVAAADEEPFMHVRHRISGNHGGKRKRNRQQRQKANVTRIGLLVAGIMAVILVAFFFIQRNTPTSARMSGYDFFEVAKDTDRIMIILNGEQVNEIGIKSDGKVYLPQQYIAEQMNVRFYYDSESNAVLYTDSGTIYTFLPDRAGYQDTQGHTYETDSAVVKVLNNELYLNFEFVAARTNCNYVYAEEPARIVISTEHEALSCVTAKKEIAVRYRAGIKSKILEKVREGEQLFYSKSIDNAWSEVITASGYTGYVKTSEVSEVFTMVPEDTYTDTYTTISKDYKINMVWYQVTNVTANNNIDSYLSQTSGINTISPTWYSIANEQGDLSSLVSADFVRKMKDRGIEVWPLINDFDKTLDYKAIYSSKAARTNMINRLIEDAVKYGYNGINVDFENIKSEYAQDFLQFIRELSLACQEKNLVLSTDNYKPESYNSSYNLKEQSAFVDYVIIMGYDEHYAGSDSGSVASLPFVEEAVADTVKLVPGSQVINAMPFYTRIWTEDGSGTTSRAVGMQAAIDDLKANGAVALWDDTVSQYFGSYEKDGATVKIWFEEDKSIEEKMKLVEKYQLAGVSGWKLGLEKPSVWNVINSYLGNQ